MATEAYGEAAASGGMPQLDPSSFANQIFWLILALLAIFFLLSRIALPRIATILAERQGTITNDLRAAKEMSARAQEAEQAYEKALADAKAQSVAIAGEAKDAIQAGLDQAIADADARIAEKTAESSRAIAAIKAEAQTAMHVVATDAAQEIASKLGHVIDTETLGGIVEKQVKG